MCAAHSGESRRSEEKHPQETITHRVDLVIAVWLAQRQKRFGRAGQRNRKPNQSENTKLPCAHAPVKVSPLRFDPLTRRLAPTMDSRSASGPGPHRPKRRILPFWPASMRPPQPTCDGSPNLSAQKISEYKPTSQYLFRFSERPVFREQAKGTVQGANNMPQSV